MSKPTTKAELVADIAERANFSKAQAVTSLDAVVASICAQLVSGNSVSLQGLAKFEVRDRPARQVRNVSTGEMMDKDADRMVKVSPLSGIKAAVNTV